MDNLETFLQTQADAGTTFESSREFSVNLIAAHQKLGKYSLPRSTAWILKFVQAGTEADTDKLGLTLGRDRVEIAFPPDAFGEVPMLRDRLETLSPKDSAEDHLFGGLLALHSLPGDVYVESGDARWYPAETREFEDLSVHTEQTRVVYLPERRSFWEQLKARIWFTSGLLEELRKNCYGCPLDLRVDERDFSLGREDLPLLSGLIKGPAGADLDYYGQLERETGNKKRTFCSWGSSRPDHIGYAIQIRLADNRSGGSLSMEWMRSGVIVKRESVDIPGGLPLVARILIPTRGLQFDASGFAIKDNEESRKRRSVGATYLEHAVEAVKGDLGRPGRWDRFLRRNYPEHRSVNVDRLISQLEDCVDSCKDSFSRER